MTHADIIARLTAATGPDKEIDLDIARWEGWTQHSDADDTVYTGRVTMWWAEPGCEWSTCSNPPSYTASIDACLALIERVLPEANCHGYDKDPSPCGVVAYVSRNCVSEGHWHYEGERPTVPLALLLALFQALETTGVPHHG